MEAEDTEGCEFLTVVVLDIVVVEDGIVLWGRRENRNRTFLFTRSMYIYSKFIIYLRSMFRFVIADIIKILASVLTIRMNEGTSSHAKLGSKLIVV